MLRQRSIQGLVGLLVLCGAQTWAWGQAITLEVRPDALEYPVGEPVFVDLIASWDPALIEPRPMADPALAGFSFRLDIGEGLTPVGIVFDPELDPDAVINVFESSGVEISGVQPSLFMNPLIDRSNPITIATVECVAIDAPVLADLTLVPVDVFSIAVFNDALGFSTFLRNIGDPDFEAINAQVFVGGGPCCDEPCNPADLSEPYEQLDFSDVVEFLSAFSGGLLEADLAEPFGTYDFSDVVAFLGIFGQGCP